MTSILKRNLLEVRMAIQRWIWENANGKSWYELEWKFKMDFEILPDDDLMFLFWKIFREMLQKGQIKAQNGVYMIGGG